MMMAYVFWVSLTSAPRLSSLSCFCGLYSYNTKTVFAHHNILEKAYFTLQKYTVIHFRAR